MVVLLTSSEVLAVPTCRGDAGGVTKVIVGGATTFTVRVAVLAPLILLSTS